MEVPLLFWVVLFVVNVKGFQQSSSCSRFLRPIPMIRPTVDGFPVEQIDVPLLSSAAGKPLHFYQIRNWQRTDQSLETTQEQNQEYESKPEHAGLSQLGFSFDPHADPRRRVYVKETFTYGGKLWPSGLVSVLPTALQSFLQPNSMIHLLLTYPIHDHHSGDCIELVQRSSSYRRQSSVGCRMWCGTNCHHVSYPWSKTNHCRRHFFADTQGTFLPPRIKSVSTLLIKLMFFSQLLEYSVKSLQLNDLIHTQLFDLFDISQPLPPADVVIFADLLYNKPLGKGTARRVYEAYQRGSWVIVGSQKGREGREEFTRELYKLGIKNTFMASEKDDMQVEADACGRDEGQVGVELLELNRPTY